MILPCLECKHAYTRHDGSGFRSFTSCTDKERQEKHFRNDSWTYRHSCTGHEPGAPVDIGTAHSYADYLYALTAGGTPAAEEEGDS